jgi:pyruvate/2-oxoglutarate dehydrogenase complex dihydrolipoamide dehydrogenase (E3) component
MRQDNGNVDMELEWIIVGGGIHGVHLAARLLGEVGVKPDGVRIIDPGDRLLARWREMTAITGMTHLRSPSVHHIDLERGALKTFAGGRRSGRPDLFALPYFRPSLRLFNAHADHVVAKYGLKDLHIRQLAVSGCLDARGVSIELSNGSAVAARHVLLAIGSSDQPAWPDWAGEGAGRIHHIFEAGFREWPPSTETVAVLGGGISAGQVALRLMGEGHRVSLIAEHPLREHRFDSEPGWLGPRFMTGFRRERDYARRRKLISEARHRGSVPPEIRTELGDAMVAGKLDYYETTIDGVEMMGDRLALHLHQHGTVAVDRLLLATGFAARRPGGAFVDSLIDSGKLSCAGCGYPIVDAALRWHPRIYVTGPLAELELGPVARNISGARRAGQRIVDSIIGSRGT